MNAAISSTPRVVRWIVGVCIVAFAAWSVWSLHADFGRISVDALARSWHLILATLGLSILNYALRAIRWHGYLLRLGHALPLGFSTLTYVAGFAFTLSPGKLGEMMRASYYVPANIPVRDIAAAFFVERLMDLAAVLMLAMLIAASSPEYRIALWSGAVTIALALIVLTMLPWTRIAGILDTSRRSGPLIQSARHIAGMLANARRLLRPRIALTGFLIGALAWLLEGLGLSVLTSMLGPANLSATLAIGIYAIATLAGVISFLPGGLGTTELVMTGLLTANGYAIADALSIALLCRIATLWLAVALGWVAVGILRQPPRLTRS